jgi:hypothetical protein
MGGLACNSGDAMRLHRRLFHLEIDPRLSRDLAQFMYCHPLHVIERRILDIL